MVINSILGALSGLDFYEYHRMLLDSNFFTVIFPFLLVYAVISTALTYTKFMKNKKTGKPYKAVITVISLVVAFYGVSFEISPGHSLSSLLMVMFPNVSAMTLGFLMMYIIGAIFGFDFMNGLFRKDISAYILFAFGAIGLMSVIYYVGISMGFWNLNPFDTFSMWNFILAGALIIAGVVFLFIGMAPVGSLFLFVVGVYIYNGGAGSILDYFIDPFVFIASIFIFLIGFVNPDKDKKELLAKSILERESDPKFKDYKKFKSRIDDISDQTYQDNKKKWNSQFPNEKDSWSKYK